MVEVIEVKLTRNEAAALIAAAENMRRGWSPEAEADSGRGADALQDALDTAARKETEEAEAERDTSS